MQESLITYEMASQIAYDAIQKTVFEGIGKAYDIGDCYMFIADNPDVIYYTCRTVLVNKSTGDIEWYSYDDTLKNENKEKTKKELEVMKEYSYQTFC